MKHWQWVPLHKISSPKQWPTIAKRELVPTGYPVYGANGHIGFAREFTHREPTILIGCRGSCGSVHITEPMSYATGNAMALDNLDVSLVDLYFLHYFLRFRGFEDVTTGTAQLQITQTNLRRVLVPLPPIVEQRRIAAILDKANAVRRKRKEAINLAAGFLSSAFLDMFGDPVTNPRDYHVEMLGEVVDIISGGTPSRAEKKFWSGNFAWVSPKDMKSTEISDSVEHIDESVFTKTVLKKIPFQAILIVVRGMILAHTIPIAITTKEVAINQDIKALIPRQSILPQFLLWSLIVQHNFILSKVSTAAHGTRRLDMADLKKIGILLPDIGQQRKFVEIVDKFSTLKEQQTTSSKKSEKMFSALAQRAFRGEL